MERYQREHSLPEHEMGFSEKDLIQDFKGEAREMKRYILDSVRMQLCTTRRIA